MKKFFTITGISFMFLLTSCDDGNLVYNDIDFSKVTAVQRCTTPGADKIFYKLQNDEALILVVDADNLMKDEAKNEIETEINGTSTTLDYRKYTSKVDGTSICNLPPPATPSVIQSIPASPGGTVIINRYVQITNPNTQANKTVNLIYQYIFSLKNINFNKGDSNIKYDKMLFGSTNYANRTLKFEFNNNNNLGLNDYNCNGAFYNLKDQEALSLVLSEEDLPKDATTTDKIIELSKEHFVMLKQYERGGIKLSEVCNNPGDLPGSSVNNPNRLLEFWVAINGQISIKSTWTNPIDGSPAKLRHEIKLLNTTFNKTADTTKSFTKTTLDFGTYITE